MIFPSDELDAITFLLSRGYKIEPSTQKMKRKVIKTTIQQLMTGLGRIPKQREIAAALRVSQPATVAYWWEGIALRNHEITHSEVWDKIFKAVGVKRYALRKNKIRDDRRTL